MRALYADNVVTGARNEDEAYPLHHISKDTLKKGGFNLRKFCSNSVSLRMRINTQQNPEPRSTSVAPELTEADETFASVTLRSTNAQHSGERRVLGVRWDISSDKFVICLEDIASTATGLKPTKRLIMSLVGKFYDHLGFLSPAIIHFKVFPPRVVQDEVDLGRSLDWRPTAQMAVLAAESDRIPTDYPNPTVLCN